MNSGTNTKALCHFFPLKDTVTMPVLLWSICGVSEGGMSYSHMMGHEMPVICQIIFFTHTCIAETSKRHLLEL